MSAPERSSRSYALATDAVIELRVCDCGVIAGKDRLARCGEDGRTNMRHTCPWRHVTVRVVEDERTATDG